MISFEPPTSVVTVICLQSGPVVSSNIDIREAWPGPVFYSLDVHFVFSNCNVLYGRLSTETQCSATISSTSWSLKEINWQQIK